MTKTLLILGAAIAPLVLASATPAWSQTAAPALERIDARGEPGPAAPGLPYAATNRPDRIVLTPGADPSRELAVAWRTDVAQGRAEAEIAPAVDQPNFGLSARPVEGRSVVLISENGEATHHQVRFTGLEPDTAYVYRVRGSGAWSEWFQVRTAPAGPAPLRFIYLGDAQNQILDVASIAIRQAVLTAGGADLMLHAGDLVASRDDMLHDDEWGQWTQAGGYALAMIPQVPATGNHEYVDLIRSDGSESRRLAPHWPSAFALPANGAPGAEATTYYLDRQGVRFVVLDGTSALDLGTLEAQTAWLDATLAANPGRWSVVLMHQPIYTCARPNDTEPLKTVWRPILERHGVDLVLQGHDHCYARVTAEAGRDAAQADRDAGGVQGPVYVVSVTGAKMYGLNDRAATQPDRVAEVTRLFQIVDIDGDRLRYRAHTATGALYDAFDLTKGTDGVNRLTTPELPLLPTRRCEAGRGPDGLVCTAEPKD